MIAPRFKTHLLMILAGFGLLPCMAETPQDQPPLQISAAWVREAPPTARMHAAYLQFHNHGEAPLVIHSVSSPDYRHAMFHRTVQRGETSAMEHLASLSIGPGDSLSLTPGHTHIMLMQPQRSLKAGDAVELCFTFAEQASVCVTAPVQKDKPDRKAMP